MIREEMIVGTLTKFSKPMPTVVESAVAYNPRKWVDRKTASILLLFSIQLGIGIIALSYRGCDPTGNNNSRNNHDVRTIFVHVIGRVRIPGVYQIPHGSKAYDAIARAGGSLPSANLDMLDLTRTLSDEEQIVVP